MKNNSKIILYDDDCPLCAAYTSAFVKTGILEKAGRKNFNNIDSATFNRVDKSRCNNEIPLIDIETMQVWYGMDALLELLNTKIPFIKKIGNIQPVKWFLNKLYKLISYNRKVIVAKHSNSNYDCSPDFIISYRIFFLVILFVFNTMILSPLHIIVFSHSFITAISLIQVQIIHTLFVFVNVLVSFFLGKKNGLEYVGQINMLIFSCILLLTPLLIVNKVYGYSHNDFNNFYIGMVSVITIWEYTRRMKYFSVFHNSTLLVVFNCIYWTGSFIYLIF